MKNAFTIFFYPKKIFLKYFCSYLLINSMFKRIIFKKVILSFIIRKYVHDITLKLKSFYMNYKVVLIFKLFSALKQEIQILQFHINHC